MQLVDDRLLPRSAPPVRVLPVEPGGIDHLTGASHVLGLKAGRGIRHGACAIDAIAITAASRRLFRHQLKPAVIQRLHGQSAGAAIQLQLHRLRRGRPQTEANAPVNLHSCAKRHYVSSSHVHFSLVAIPQPTTRLLDCAGLAPRCSCMRYTRRFGAQSALSRTRS